MQIKLINIGLQIRHQKRSNKLIIVSDKYTIHLKAFLNTRKGKWPLACKIKDRKTNSVVKSDFILFNEKIDLKKIKKQLLDCFIPDELKTLEAYVFTSEA